MALNNTIAIAIISVTMGGEVVKNCPKLRDKRLVGLFDAEFSLPGVDFTNVFRAHFSYEHLFSSYLLFCLYKKRAQKTLVKLTPGGCNSTNFLLESVSE